MKMLVLLAAAMSVAVGVIARQPDPAPLPAELVALLAKASISDRVVDWCAAAFQDETIKQSETIEGSLAPHFNTTVVCGFVEATQAVCWQYASRVRRFIVVGRWRT